MANAESLPPEEWGHRTALDLTKIEDLKKFISGDKARCEAALSGEGWFYRYDRSVTFPGGRDPLILTGNLTYIAEHPEAEIVRDDGVIERRFNIVPLEREEVEAKYQRTLDVEVQIERLS